MSVAKLWDDLWVGVISQSNLVIAGSLRNILKYGGQGRCLGVGRFLAHGDPRPLKASNTRQQRSLLRHKRAKVLCQEGNSPDRSIRR